MTEGIKIGDPGMYFKQDEPPAGPTRNYDEVESMNELIERQNGRMIVVIKKLDDSFDEEEAEREFMEEKWADQPRYPTKEISQSATEQLPGIFNIYDEDWTEGVSYPLGSMTYMTPEGTFYVSPPSMETSAKFIPTKQDWDDESTLVREYKGKLVASLPDMIDNIRKQVELMEKLMAQYPEKRPPVVTESDYQDLTRERGIIDPSLGPDLQGGNPMGITTNILKDIVHMDTVSFEDQEYRYQLLIGDFSIIQSGRKVALDYYKLASEISLEKPDLRKNIEKSGGIFYGHRVPVKEYVDSINQFYELEWQRREQALAIAEKVKNILASKLKYLERLQSDIA